jgi:hypothetical protein
VGRLEDGQGTALSSATIYVYSLSDDASGSLDEEHLAAPVLETESGLSGSFDIEGAPVGRVAIIVRPPGHSRTTLYTYLRHESDVRDLGVIVLPAVGIVRLSTVDEAGNVVIGAMVTYTDGPREISGWSSGDQHRLAGYTDQQGKLSIVDLRSGPSQLLITADGYLSYDQIVDPSIGGDLEVQAVLIKSLYIEGDVIRPKALAGAKAVVRCNPVPGSEFDEVLGPESVECAVHSDGRYRLGPFPLSLADQQFTLSVGGPGGYEEELQHSVTATPGDSAVSLFVADAAYLRTYLPPRVVESVGLLESATLELFSESGSLGYTSEIPFTIESDSDAPVIFRVPTGLVDAVFYRLDLRFAHDVGFYSEPFVPVAGETLELGRIHAVSRKLMQIRIVDHETGRPLSGANAYVYQATLDKTPFSNHVRSNRPTEGGMYGFTVSHGTSSPDGSVDIYVSEESDLELLLHANGYVPVVRRPGESVDPALVVGLLQGSTVCFRILDGDEPYENCSLKPISIPESYPQSRLRQCGAGLPSRSADPGGFIVYSGLPAGSYRYKLLRTPTREVRVITDGFSDAYYEERF